MLRLTPLFLITVVLATSAQTPTQPYPFVPPPPPQTYPQPLTDTNEGIQPIFDGTLKNWDGDSQYINYRSVAIAGTKWLLRGYQAGIDGADK
jgi:hypothetical protein